MKKQLLLLVMMLLPIVASAEAVEIDGIYYNLITKGNIAEVTRNPNMVVTRNSNNIDNPNYYSGSISIPENVTYNDVNYYVTSIDEWAFGECSDLISVSIPNSVTSIGSRAFENCI